LSTVPKAVEIFMSLRYTDISESVPRDAKTATTIHQDDRSFTRSRVAAARRAASAHARRDFVRTKVGIRLSLDLGATCVFFYASAG